MLIEEDISHTLELSGDVEQTWKNVSKATKMLLGYVPNYDLEMGQESLVISYEGIYKSLLKIER